MNETKRFYRLIGSMPRKKEYMQDEEAYKYFRNKGFSDKELLHISRNLQTGGKHIAKVVHVASSSRARAYRRRKPRRK